MTKTTLAALGRVSFCDYVAIARPDHWVKNIFMLPGAAVAFVVDPAAETTNLLPLSVGIVSTCLVASANYTINEFLDGKFDRHHPTKHMRPSARGLINPLAMLAQYLLLAGVGLLIASTIGTVFLLASIALLAMGLVYNVEPIRSKDRPYIDVLSESINNPIRLVLGWAAVTTIVLPPVSLLICYWMGGAYLMAIKRFSEYRMIGDPARAALYRRSFGHYTADSLLISAFFYALTLVFFLSIFLIKYRVEFVISFPFFAVLFAWYLRLALTPTSDAANPEKLYRNKPFMVYVGFLIAVVTALFIFDLPALHYLSSHIVTSDPRVGR